MLLMSALFSAEAHATTYNAATCNESDVSSAIATATGAGSGNTVDIPSGTCTWTTQLVTTLSVSLNIIGAGNQSVTGGGDVTNIVDHVDHNSCNCSMWAIATGSSSNVVRISGITIEQDSGSISTDNGIVTITGSSQSLRWDHSHFVINASVSGSSLNVDIDGWMYGVFDHNLFDLLNASVNNGVRIGHGTWNGQSLGNGSWNDTEYFGSNQFMFFEDNTFNGGAANDCNDGGRFVLRHNTFNDSFTQAHEMENDLRGCRAWEEYSNTFNGTASDSIDSSDAMQTRMGTGLAWGNVSTGMHTFLDLNNDRTNTGHSFAAPPNGWGYCGTTYGPSGWDQNSGSSGYACVDQVGRGKGDLLTGTFPNKCDQTSGACSTNTYTGTWPNQALVPVYEWLDEWSPANGYSGGLCTSGDTNTVAQNRDFYCYTLAWNGSSFTGTAFNGTVGTGSGLLAGRPSTCASGPSGNTSGVAYWATDQNTLYVCNPTNTWTSYYIPYTYPHPLVQGQGQPPGPPSGLQAIVD